jgi:hypothetical protein
MKLTFSVCACVLLTFMSFSSLGKGDDAINKMVLKSKNAMGEVKKLPRASISSEKDTFKERKRSTVTISDTFSAAASSNNSIRSKLNISKSKNKIDAPISSKPNILKKQKTPKYYGQILRVPLTELIK